MARNGGTTSGYEASEPASNSAPLEPQYVLRGGSQRFYGFTVVVFAAFILLASVVTSGLDGLDSFAGLVVGAVLLAWVFFLSPHLLLNPGGVHIRNPFRTIDIPFADIGGIEPRWGLTVRDKTDTSSRVAALPGKGMEVSDPWAERRAAKFLPGSSAPVPEFNSKIEIPLWESGTYSLTASTRSASRLIDEMMGHYNSKWGRRHVPKDAAKRVLVNWINVLAAGVGVGAVAWNLLS